MNFENLDNFDILEEAAKKLENEIYFSSPIKKNDFNKTFDSPSVYLNCEKIMINYFPTPKKVPSQNIMKTPLNFNVNSKNIKNEEKNNFGSHSYENENFFKEVKTMKMNNKKLNISFK